MSDSEVEDSEGNVEVGRVEELDVDVDAGDEDFSSGSNTTNTDAIVNHDANDNPEEAGSPSASTSASTSGRQQQSTGGGQGQGQRNTNTNTNANSSAGGEVNNNNNSNNNNSMNNIGILQQSPSEKKGTGILLRTLAIRGSGRYYPSSGDTVKVHYEAYLFDDLENASRRNLSNRSNSSSASNNNNRRSRMISVKPFDSSVQRHQPFCFVLGKGQVIHGLEVAVRNMCLGQVAEVTIPHTFAYGNKGYPPLVPPMSTLVFRIELMDFALLTET